MVAHFPPCQAFFSPAAEHGEKEEGRRGRGGEGRGVHTHVDHLLNVPGPTCPLSHLYPVKQMLLSPFTDEKT